MEAAADALLAAHDDLYALGSDSIALRTSAPDDEAAYFQSWLDEIGLVQLRTKVTPGPIEAGLNRLFARKRSGGAKS